MKSSPMPSLFFAIALSGCVHSKVQTTFDPPYPEHGPNGDAILAVYVGRIPCHAESCDRLKVQLVLYRNPVDQAPTWYWLGVVGAHGNDRIVTRGRWVRQRGVAEYPESPVYALDASADPELRYFWRVNEDILLILDQGLRPKVGDGAWGYMLSRDPEPYGPRTYRYDERRRRFIGSTLNP